MIHAATSNARRSIVLTPLSKRVHALKACAAALIALAAACASPQEVQQTRDYAKACEIKVYDLQRQLAECVSERSRISDQLSDMRLGSLSNASFSGEVTDRIASLEEMLDGLGRPVKDIERFDVEGGYILMIQDKVLFESGSDELGQEGQLALRTLAGEIHQRPHGEIFVRGHTDSDPVKKEETKRRFPNGNLQLSAARAISVGAFMISQYPASAKDIVVMGFGQWSPLKPNDSAENKRLNRRVEIFVSDPAKS